MDMMAYVACEEEEGDVDGVQFRRQSAPGHRRTI